MTERIFTAEEQEEVEALARRRGFSQLREYVRTLVEADAQQHGEPMSFAEDEDDQLGDPAESFRRGWAQAMRGEFITLEEFRKSMENDD